jgi:plastocyanin
VAYNLASEGFDGEASVARRIGRVRILGAARLLSSPVVAGETRFALGGGATLRLTRYVALAGDVAQVVNGDRTDDRAAWSAGLHVAIPYTPHSLSLQATNTNVGTLQGVSRGSDIVRYGFEFTVPLNLRRWVGRPTTPEITVAPPRTDTVYVVRRDSIARAPVAAARADTVRVDTLPAAPAQPEPAPAVPPAAGRTSTRRPAVVRPAVVTVVLRNTAFVPGRIQITAGTTVVWRNDDQLIHTVTANDKSFDSGLLQPGKTYRRTFDKPGQYPYYCLPHPFMKGVVVVR